MSRNAVAEAIDYLATSGRPFVAADDNMEDDLPAIVRAPTLEDAALRGPLGALVQAWSPHTEAHPAGLLLCLLVAFGAMLGRTYYFVLGGVQHHANLFGMLVGLTSQGRKGTAWAIARNNLREIDKPFMEKNVAAGLSSGEGLIYRLSDALNGVDSSPDAVDKRLLVVEPEMTSALKRMSREGNSLSAVLRQAWDGETLSTLTKGTTGVDLGGLRATDPHLSVIGQINPPELRKHLGAIELVNGFANRFVFAFVERARLCPDESRPSDDELRAPSRQLTNVLAARKELEVRLDVSAAPYWSNELYPSLDSGAAGLAGDLAARGTVMVRRLAMIYAVADGVTEVGVGHLEAARAVWNYSLSSTRMIFGDSTLSPVAAKMLRAIEQAGAMGLDRTELRAASGLKNVLANHRNEALQELSSAGLIKVISVATAGRTRNVVVLTRFALPRGVSIAAPAG